MKERFVDKTGRRSELRDAGSLQEHSYRTIRDRVLSHVYGPSAVLRELELAQEIGVSRTPVRAALEELVSDGLLERIRGAGYTVIQMTPKMVADLYEVRAPLEVQSVFLVDRAGNPERWARLERLFSALEGVTGEPTDDQLRIAQEADHLFHREILESSGNQVALEIAERIELRLALLRSFARRERRLASVPDHLQIIRMIRSKHYDKAAGLLEEHLNSSRDYLISLMATLHAREPVLQVLPSAAELRRHLEEDKFEALIDRIILDDPAAVAAPDTSAAPQPSNVSG